MTAKDLGKFIHTGKYANYIPEAKRRESKIESGDRSMDMHVDRYGHLGQEVLTAIESARESMHADLVLGSQRMLQYGGTPILKKHARGYNCCASHADRPRFFQEAFWLLLCGCGTGFSVQKHHVEKLPNLVEEIDRPTMTYTVPDTIEGWADSLGVLMSSFFVEPDVPFPEYRAHHVEFDLSQIRSEGSPLSSTTSGKAPGPEPLRRALSKIRELLQRCVDAGQLCLRPIDAYDVVMHMSDAVLSGGVRRSASICIFSADDDDMAQAKTGAWMRDNPQRGRSNNSALLLRGETSRERFDWLIECAKTSGDPGFYWSDNVEFIPNPCQPASAPVITRDGLRTFADIDTGSEIWSETGWTNVVKKWKTGTKPVYKYQTTAGFFIGTDKHRIVCDGEKIEVGNTEAVDILCGPSVDGGSVDPVDVMDGVVIGDGTVHKAGGGLFLIIGEKDECYMQSEISHLIKERGYGGDETWARIKTTVTDSEVPFTYQRRVPQRFLNGSHSTARGFLRGLYTANGSVIRDRVTLKTASPKIREDVQLMLCSLGIRSYFTTNKAHFVKFKNGEYECRESYDINIGVDAQRFQSLIGFIHPEKSEKLKAVVLDRSDRQSRSPKKTYDIIGIEYLGDEDVFDITVDNDPHTYWTGGLNVSNCAEISFYPIDKLTEKTGWGFCNLSTVNMEACKTRDDALLAAHDAAILGTLQAGYTDFEYLGEVSERIAREESLLGVSMTGMMRNPKLAFDADLLKEMAEEVKSTNKWMAGLLGINVAARATCLKPEGTGSLTLQTSSGITADHARRYFKLVAANHNENHMKFFEGHNPGAVSPNSWDPNKKNKLITFCIEAPEHATLKGDMTAVELLEKVKLVKEAWVDNGKRPELCRHVDLSHNVSNTIDVGPGEWGDVADFIFENQYSFAGVALLSSFADLDIRQAPNTRVKTADEIYEEYGQGALFVSVLSGVGDGIFSDLWAACDTALGCVMGIGVDFEKPTLNAFIRKAQIGWVDAVKEMASNYFDDDVRLTTYAIKDMWLLSRWNDLQRSWKTVDYNQMIEEENNVKLGDTVACAGGACETGF